MTFIPTYCKDLSFSANKFEFLNVLNSNWTIVVGLCLVVTSLLMVILYLLSELLRDQKLKAWCKFEFFQIILTAVLLIFISGMLHWMCTFDVSSFYKWADPANANSKISSIISNCNVAPNTKIVTPYCAMNHYLDKLKDYGKILFWILFTAAYYLSSLTNFSVAAHPIGMGFNIEPGGGLRQFANLMTVAMTGYTLSFISLYVQQHLIRFLLISMPYYFLPIGILLRAFAPTREFGGAIIGFVIASIFFYPFTFVLADIAIGETFNPVTLENVKDSLSKETPIFQQKMLESSDSSFQQSKADPNKFIESSLDTESFLTPSKNEFFNTILFGGLGFSILKLLGASTTLALSPFLIAAVIYFGQLVFSLIALYFIGAAVIPLLNFIVYIQAAASISQMIGSRLDISNITRMI